VCSSDLIHQIPYCLNTAAEKPPTGFTCAPDRLKNCTSNWPPAC
jgi:hypothetical protein